MTQNYAISLEENRLKDVTGIDDYQMLHERHRIFPAVFEKRNHKKIIDLSAGVGIVGNRIKKWYNAKVVCNDISPTCLASLRNLGLETMAFDIDNNSSFPISDNEFDAVITLATIEHLTNTEHFLREIYRILTKDGFLYISAPNYSGLTYLIPFLVKGKTFHDPMSKASQYEFYAHVKYFTYTTLLEYVSSIGFIPESVYLAIPEGSTRYQMIKSKSNIRALIFRYLMKLLYICCSPRWAAEPVICFKKSGDVRKIKKVVL